MIKRPTNEEFQNDSAHCPPNQSPSEDLLKATVTIISFNCGVILTQHANLLLTELVEAFLVKVLSSVLGLGFNNLKYGSLMKTWHWPQETPML